MFYILRRSPFIRNFAKLLLEKDKPPPLGRWNIEECQEKIKSKIDLSNEDHCGPCGQYSMQKINDRIQDLENKIENKIKNKPKDQ